MIASVRGVVALIGEDHLVIEVSGVGLQVFTTHPALAQAQAGAPAHLHTYLYLREDQISLYGFPTLEERALFVKLMQVSGIGPKVALALLSAMKPAELAGAVEMEDLTRLQRVPGVGKRVAARLVLELKGKLATAPSEAAVVEGGNGFVIAAIEQMGFSRAEAFSALARIPQDPELSDEQRIFLAFRALGRR